MLLNSVVIRYIGTDTSQHSQVNHILPLKKKKINKFQDVEIVQIKFSD